MSSDVTGRRVLLVDDDPVIRMLIGALLRRGGYSVDIAADGSEALQQIAAGLRVDLVITDLNMPNLSGDRLIESLRTSAETATLPIIVLTASEEASRQASLIQAGATACLSKPVNPKTFVDEIHAVMGW